MEQPEVIQDSAVEAEKPAATEPAEQLDQTLVDALQEQQADDDEIEDDLDGVKVKGKKEAVEKLKAERLMQADYTRKTQASAEIVRAAEAERAAIKQSAQLYQTHLSVVAELVSMDKQIEQYKQVDWDALTESDPVQAQKLDRQYRTLQERKQQGMQALGQLQQRHALEEQQTTAKQIENAAEVLRREVPNWSATRDNELRDFAVKQGIPAEALRELVVKAPGLGKIFHMADQYARLVAKTTTKPAPEAQEKPVTRVSATRTTANKDPDRMSVEEWTRWREAQIRRK